MHIKKTTEPIYTRILINVIYTHRPGIHGCPSRGAFQALLPLEMPSFAQFAERYSYKQPGPGPSVGVRETGGPKDASCTRTWVFHIVEPH